MEKLLQITGSLLLVVVYFIYLKQTSKGESTPNPGTWITWFAIMGINTLTYFQVVHSDYFKSAIVFIGFLSIFAITSYSLIKGKFAKPKLIDIILFFISIIIAIFWRLTKNANVASLLLQLTLLVSFLPTAIGVMQERLKEKHWPWTLAGIAYLLQTISLLINYDGNIYQLFLPVINGVLGNGLVAAAVLYKKSTELHIMTPKVKH